MAWSAHWMRLPQGRYTVASLLAMRFDDTPGLLADWGDRSLYTSHYKVFHPLPFPAGKQVPN